MLNANIILKRTKLFYNKISLLNNFNKKPFYKKIVNRFKDVSIKNKTLPFNDETPENDPQFTSNKNGNYSPITNLDIKYLYVSIPIIIIF